MWVGVLAAAAWLLPDSDGCARTREEEKARASIGWVVVPVERIELPTFGLKNLLSKDFPL